MNDREIFYTKEFNSIKSGLNIVEAGKVGYGVNSNASKYDKLTILKVYSNLFKTTKAYIDIAKELGVTNSLVANISDNVTHKWLGLKYPFHKKIIDSKKETRVQNSTYRHNPIKLLSPTGTVFTITNIRKFCEEELSSSSSTSLKHIIKGISRLVNGNSKTYKGWSLHPKP